MKRWPLFLIAVAMQLFLPFVVEGQLDVGIDSEKHIECLRSVKQLGEFIDRFNQDAYEVPDSDPNRSLVLDRKQSILLLFNRDDPRFDKNSPEYSQEYETLVLKFADEVVENEIYLDKYSEQIRAIVTASIHYRGKPETVTLILTQELDEPKLVRWVISDVQADFLDIPPRDTTMVRFLSPVSHELGFMDLKKAFGEPDHMIDYVREDYVYDQLGVFLYAIHDGDIILKELVEVFYNIGLNSKYVIKVIFSENQGMVPHLEITDIS